VVADGIWGARYPLALASSKIALGLLSKRIPETTTTRTFEIPAMGVFMLAERTDDHLALFKEGIEAEFFGSDDELQEKIGFYLSHDDARLKIAAAGRKRCIQSGYDARSQLEKVLAHLTSLAS
jgi:spore maturation protein CgeB